MALMGVSAAVALVLSLAGNVESGPDRLYGRVVTRSGDVHVGYLRWDRNEANWTDFLDALREVPSEYLKDAERLDPEVAARMKAERSIVAFGVRITWEEDDESGPLGARTAIRFGHVASLSPVDDRSALLTLRDGGELTLRSSSTDLGSGMRPLIIDVGNDRSESVRWRNLERVDFFEPPPDAAGPAAERIHGTLTTWEGLEFTGYVSWDLDEILTTDILDGRLRGRNHEIPFELIREIAWDSNRSARVRLTSGEEVTLRGTNDVDRTNRGIEVSDPSFGRVTVDWEGFRSVRLTPAVPARRPDHAPSDPITGTVYARDGRVLQGEIRWGNRDTQLWETLTGWFGEARLDIEYGAISRVERIPEDAVRVTLRDGRTFELADEPDVDDRNEGIFVKPTGRPLRLVRWRDLERVEFEHASR